MSMILLSFILLMVRLGSLPPSPGVKSYSVKKIPGAVAVTGKGDDPQWKNANELTDFTYPWEKEKTPATKFRALHNDDWFYGLFDVTDNHVILAKNDDDKAAVGASSRSEIFFRVDEKMTPYYGLELDPQGRVLDYQVSYYRKFNSKWSWPKGQLIIKTSRRKDGYSIEFAISKSSLKELGLIKNKSLQAGIFRADCLREGKSDADFKWASWVRPDSKTPDFHLPSSFGVLLLED